ADDGRLPRLPRRQSADAAVSDARSRGCVQWTAIAGVARRHRRRHRVGGSSLARPARLGCGSGGSGRDRDERSADRRDGRGARAAMAMPLTIGAWRGVDQPPLDADTERVLAADSYINRDYSSAGHAGVGLYVAYYAQQRPGASIHSPLHCLPGTGWEPSDVRTLTLARLGGPGSWGTLRRMIVRKHLDQALVLYWYSIHGRMLANEFASKAWLIH